MHFFSRYTILAVTKRGRGPLQGDGREGLVLQRHLQTEGCADRAAAAAGLSARSALVQLGVLRVARVAEHVLVDALRVAARRTGLGEHLLAGGLVMVPLLLIGAAALVLTAWKLLALRSVRTPARGLVEDVVDHLDHGRLDEARARAEAAERAAQHDTARMEAELASVARQVATLSRERPLRASDLQAQA